jgi:hypothetical protein
MILDPRVGMPSAVSRSRHCSSSWRPATSNSRWSRPVRNSLNGSPGSAGCCKLADQQTADRVLEQHLVPVRCPVGAGEVLADGLPVEQETPAPFPPAGDPITTDFSAEGDGTAALGDLGTADYGTAPSVVKGCDPLLLEL